MDETGDGLIAQLRELVRNEIVLARREIGGKLQGLAFGVVFLAAALVFALLSAVAFLIAGVFLLSLVVPTWAAAFIVMIALVICAAIFGLVARGFIARAMPLVPERTVASLKREMTWTKLRHAFRLT